MKRILLGWAAVCGMASLAEAQYSYCVTNSDPTGAGWTYVNQASGYRHNSCMRIFLTLITVFLDRDQRFCFG